jgi:DNA helicase-2/ATP-dependent DNA helicase PcrA
MPRDEDKADICEIPRAGLQYIQMITNYRNAMEVSSILDPLNIAQRAAVTADDDHVLVLAGAGSGKTRVLVHRIAWLCRIERVSPYSILAVTFTNKAALEIRSRVETLLGISAGGMWVGTFHGLSHRVLRAHWQEANLPQAFQILDSDDQYRLIRRILKGLTLDESKWPPRQAQWFINNRKDEALRSGALNDDGDPVSRQLIRIYAAYEAVCERGGLVDFAELLLRSLELFKHNPELIAHYRTRFRHILVDEFQDTNTLQYHWLKLLAGDRTPVFAVGDDDQSIYGWRGARVENIRSFSQDFQGCVTCRLEQNYRSTGTILAAANSLIEHNVSRLGKQLWTNDGEGEPIKLFAAYNEQDEARFVATCINEWVAGGRKRQDIAVLYRSNAQSRIFEEVLFTQGIPYRVYGGLRFFERAEIKDALAYLRLAVNDGDDASFERIVNLPPRGIGDRTLTSIRSYAQDQSTTLWEAAQALIAGRSLNARATKAIGAFLNLIATLWGSMKELPLPKQVEIVIAQSGLKDYYAQEGGERGQTRLDNLDELVNAARAFNFDPNQHGNMSRLDAFLSHAALEAGESQGESWEDCIQLMTLHSAKGLEFPLVMLVGMEEGLFPHRMSLQEPARLEEERRLCYVGITRAREHLTLTYAETRRHFAVDNYNPPSRFIGELPCELLLNVRPRITIRPTYTNRDVNSANFDKKSPELTLGQRVVHAGFGEGVVVDYEGSGRHARVQVKFDAVGNKWLVLEYAKLHVI